MPYKINTILGVKMKLLVLLLATISLSGCMVTRDNIDKAEELCANNGGLEKMRMATVGGQMIVFCKDNQRIEFGI